jgi:hypothetical protein
VEAFMQDKQEPHIGSIHGNVYVGQNGSMVDIYIYRLDGRQCIG